MKESKLLVIYYIVRAADRKLSPDKPEAKQFPGW